MPTPSASSEGSASPPGKGRRDARKPPLGVTLIATALGAGLLPGAPGTFGTLLAIPLAVALDRLGGELAILIALLVVTVVGSWAADVYCECTRSHDNQQIVIDEVAGYLVTIAVAPRSGANLIAGFVLFRLFDIWKPPPVRWIDRHVKGGFGVVADDLGAGVYAALCLFLLEHFHVTSAIASFASQRL